MMPNNNTNKTRFYPGYYRLDKLTQIRTGMAIDKNQKTSYLHLKSTL